MKLASFFFSVVISLGLGNSSSFACSCAPVPLLRPNETIESRRASIRNYFLNEFSGAAFVGKITKREAVLVNDSPTYRYTVKIDEYWLGIASPVITVYGEAGDSFPFGLFDRGAGITSCGFRLEKGKRFFFTPNRSQGSVLEIKLCDYAGGASGLDGRAYTEFRKVMGEPMHFDRK